MPRKLALRGVVAIFVTVLIFAIGFKTITFQIHRAIQRDRVHSAQLAVIQIDSLLKEAEDASFSAQHWLLASCTSGVRIELNRLTIASPHLRVLGLLKGEHLMCSSFSSSSARIVDLSQFAENQLSLRLGSAITPNSPLLILLTHFKDGTVSVSLSVTHVTEILSSFRSQGNLSLRVGAELLSPEGTLSHIKPSKNGVSVESGLFPYSVLLDVCPELTLLQIIHQEMLLIVLFGVIGLLAGGAKLAIRL